MKVLICLFGVLALANAGLLVNNGLFNSGVYSTGSLVSSPITYVETAPALHTVQVVKQPVYKTVSSTVYTATAPVYHSTIYRSSHIVSAPTVVSAPVISQSYGLTYGSRYAGSYAIGDSTNAITVLNNGLLKRQ